ncbi:MAG: STAS domain-containing protein [Bryobacteraceae bacterium]|jgi:anti-sigma B factor antagonist
MFHHDHLGIHQRENEGIVILDLKGNLVLGGGEIPLRESVQALFDGGNRQLVLDLAGVSTIDTSGAGVLMSLAEQYRTAGGKLVLLQVAHVHEELYERARLEANLEIYELEQDAVNSFFPDRIVKHYDILDYIEHRNDPEAKK